MYNQKKHEQVLTLIANTYYYDKKYSNLLAERNAHLFEKNTFLAGGWK
jgi:hypothetical protein